ncbi:nucleoside phosphorylase [Mobilitalea sibirica]|uniref:Uridine phosphorylase n=1 Tax=Mobilitalea sibirica TaxID=1462919 RepID=A0A8J7H0Q1_9FIRM|nr:nucleoside phosphorylase [Mobilitalea sibirica]MBH1939748.1 nucleoside phosphorylase [Mobilitalea sibirica]
MSLIKDEYPILERDTEQLAVIMPNRRNEYSLPEKCVFAFLGDVTDHYALQHECKVIAQFESITKTYPIYSTVYKDEEICFCQAPCGASAATQILDFLIAYGVKYVIACGSCGALENIDENEIIIPNEALRDEGTSYHYIKPSRTIKISDRAINAIKRAADIWKVRYIECKTWTTDGFYRETKDMVEYRREEGCVVVEMECSALAACSEFRGIEFGQILFTADTLFNPEDYDERDWGTSSYDIALLLSLEAVRII